MNRRTLFVEINLNNMCTKGFQYKFILYVHVKEGMCV